MVKVLDVIQNNVPFVDFNPIYFLDNEHRPAIPLLVWYFDLVAFGSSGLFPLLLLYATIPFIAYIASGWAYGKNTQILYSYGVTASGLALLLSFQNYENLVWEKQVHVYFSILFSLLAFLSISKCLESRANHNFYAIASGLFALAASFSFGYGLACWPPILLFSMLSRSKTSSFTPFFIVLGFFVFTFLIYISGFTFEKHHTDPEQSLVNIAGQLRYLVSFFAMPMSSAHFGPAAFIISAALIIACTLRSLWLLFTPNGRNRLTGDPRIATSLMIYAFSFGAAYLTALVRLDVNDGQDSRYAVISIIFLICAGGLFRNADPMSEKIWPHNNASGLIAASFLTLTLVSNYFNSDIIRHRHHEIKLAAIAADFDVPIAEVGHQQLYPTQDALRRVWTFQREANSNIVDWTPFRWRGQLLDEAFSNADNFACIGFLDHTKRVPSSEGAALIFGWVRGGENLETPIDWVVAVNDADQIVGLAGGGFRRQDVFDHLEKEGYMTGNSDALHSGFSGIVRMAEDGRIRLFAVGSDGSLCQFATARSPEIITVD
ncbi:hypothetical protein [Hoeflea poritis]|uniref:Uncharacterized protein n=1 Tax=Hoeflea poritis TaxID=2993659 RepID=A0ABT4VM46_9HYPH|nr:hypothetical protein [Hoeflea poritis]MDA4845794.1 hypothetical protein [Hoeflea poritis]